jgi:hypothetical protein
MLAASHNSTTRWQDVTVTINNNKREFQKDINKLTAQDHNGNDYKKFCAQHQALWQGPTVRNWFHHTIQQWS